MENLPARVPHTLFLNLVNAFVPPDTPYDATLELVITIEGENIPAREFAAYLSLIDRLYGRLSSEGLRSYAHREHGRLQVAEIHKSDLEIIFRVLYGHEDTAIFIVLLMFLRILRNVFKRAPESAKGLTEGAKNLAEAYKTYEEGRLVRENRKHIRETIQQEPSLKELDDARKRQLIRLLDGLAAEENANLSAPIRFARHQVRDVELRVRRAETDTQTDFKDEPKNS